MIRILIYLFFTLFCFSSVWGQNCSQLPDGTYIVEPDSLFKNFPQYRYRIIKNKCYAEEDGKIKEYDIIRFSECRFRFKSNTPIDTTNFTPLQIALYRQQPFFDIYKVEGNYYYFINRVDLHVRSYSGRFVRVKD